jgi:biotin operon repressor
MNAGKLSKSPRLQRAFNLLLDGKFHTTRDIVRRASVMAVSAVISELRSNGIQIDCERRKNLWYYRIARS